MLLLAPKRGATEPAHGVPGPGPGAGKRTRWARVLKGLLVVSLLPTMLAPVARPAQAAGIHVGASPVIRATISNHTADPSKTVLGQNVSFEVRFSNSGNTAWTFQAALSLRRPDGSVVHVAPLTPVQLAPGENGSARWTYLMDQVGSWDASFGIWKEPDEVTGLVFTGWLPSCVQVSDAPAAIQAARFDSFCRSPEQPQVGQSVSFQADISSIGNTRSTFYVALTLRRPDGTLVNLARLAEVTLDPGQQGGATWDYKVDQEGNWDAAFGVWKDSAQTTALVHSGWHYDYVRVSDELRRNIVTQALKAETTSAAGGNYPSLNSANKLEEVIGVYKQCANYYGGNHIYATYHDGGCNPDDTAPAEAEAFEWLTGTPKAGGECLFFATLVAARAGWPLYLGGLSISRTTAEGPGRVPAGKGTVRPGDILIRPGNIVRGTPPHAVVVVEVVEPTGSGSRADGGMVVVESNYGWNELVAKKRFISWADLADDDFCVVDLFTPAAGTRTVFSDTGTCPWAEPAIDQLAAEGVVKGVAPGLFSPGGAVTRAQFAALLQRVFGLPAPAQPVTFLDVPVGSWQYDCVQAVAPYMPGVATRLFAPDEPVQRETVAAVLANILSAEGRLTILDSQAADATLGVFVDAAGITSERRVLVATVVKAGIMSGLEGGRFEPLGTLTRAQAAVVLFRVVMNILLTL